MKIFAFASILAFSALPAFAGEGQVSHQSLNNMGLAGLHVMTDAQGMNVRGMSIAVVSGGSGAKLIGASAGSNFYAKGDGSGTHYADGSSASVASDTLSISNGKNTFTASFTAAAATTASAKAH
jgi:hypothetical protein